MFENNQNNQNTQNNFYSNTPNNQYYNPYNSNHNQFNPFNPFVLNEAQILKNKKKKEKKELVKTGIIIGLTLIAFLVIESIVVSCLYVFGYYQTYLSSSLFQNCFNIIGVHIFSMALPFALMALILKKNFISPLIPSKKIDAMKFISWVGVGLGWCLVANVLTSFIIALFKAFGYSLTQSSLADADTPFACVALVMSTVIIPAICEEFALRCCTLGVLQKYGKSFAVFAVSIVFGLLHGNVIQFVFAFLVGLILAYITVKTGSVIPAMVIHGLNNGLSVVSEIVTYASSENIADKVVTYCYYAYFALAIFGVIYLSIKRDLKPKLNEFNDSNQSLLTTREKFLCLIPGLAIPFLILLKLSASTIVQTVS